MVIAVTMFNEVGGKLFKGNGMILIGRILFFALFEGDEGCSLIKKAKPVYRYTL